MPLFDPSIPQSNPAPLTPTTIPAGPGALALTTQQALRTPEGGALTHLRGDPARALVLSDRHVVLLTSSRLSLRTCCCFYF